MMKTIVLSILANTVKRLIDVAWEEIEFWIWNYWHSEIAGLQKHAEVVTRLVENGSKTEKWILGIAVALCYGLLDRDAKAAKDSDNTEQ